MIKKIAKEFTAIRLILALLVALLPVLVLMPAIAMAATTANITVNATPEFISISCNVSEYDFGVVAASSTTNTTTAHFGITNLSTVQTDQTIAVTSDNWTGGIGWTHDDGGSPGADTVGLLTNVGGTWGVGDIIVKYASPNYVYENCPALTDYDFGLGLQAPTSFSDGDERTNVVQITAAGG